MSTVFGLLFVLILVATVGFFAAALFWLCVGLLILFGIWVLWANLNGKPSTRSPMPEHPND